LVISSGLAASSLKVLARIIACDNYDLVNVALQPGYNGPLYAHDHWAGFRYNHAE
jgi:hypothetical protein